LGAPERLNGLLKSHDAAISAGYAYRTGRASPTLLKSRSWKRYLFERPEISVTVEYLFGLDRETDRNLGATVHNLKDVIAEQTAEFAPDSLLGNQFDTAITSFTLGTTEVGFSHVKYG
jgi:hypothetical protein